MDASVLLENNQIRISISSPVNISMTSFIAFCIELHNKKKITRWFENMNFTHLLRSFVKYCLHHSKIKSISLRPRVISSLSLSLSLSIF